jgi:hypothetical protein
VHAILNRIDRDGVVGWLAALREAIHAIENSKGVLCLLIITWCVATVGE